MGFTNIMKQQENPDGEEGHLEREFYQEWSKQFPKKKKFTGGSKQNPEHIITNRQQKELDIQQMKRDCDVYTNGCQIYQCSMCHRREKIQIKNRNRSIEKLRAIKKREREIDMKREDYWKTTIAFPCPITNVQHTINDCFNSCEMWGREYQNNGEGRNVAILHCILDAQGERELHSGKPTRDN